MNKEVSTSIPETEAIAERWLAFAAEKRASLGRALIVGLSGHLGAGKTAFTKGVGKALGIAEEITSPTFVIMKIYSTSHAHFKKLIHIDAYRLEDKNEMEVLKLNQLTRDPANLIIMEWPEHVGYEGDLDERIMCEVVDGKFTFEFR
jgi:tRNA threonylcarbamoyladenosine biosynthesis protein TsaE